MGLGGFATPGFALMARKTGASMFATIDGNAAQHTVSLGDSPIDMSFSLPF